MTNRFSGAILFEIMKKGKESKIAEYFQEHLTGAVESVRGISRATATNAAEFKIIKLKGGDRFAGGHVLGRKNDYVGNADDNNDAPIWAGEDGEQAFIRYHDQGSMVLYEEVVDIMTLDDAKQCVKMMYALGDFGKAKLRLAATKLIKDAVHQEMRDDGRIKRALRKKKKTTTKKVSRSRGGKGKHGFGQGNRLGDGQIVTKTTLILSNLNHTPK